MHLILHSIEHSFEHILEIVPILFLVFLLLEYMEHSFNAKKFHRIEKSKSFGPVYGAILGALPQCGFSVFVTNLFVSRVATIGTLVAVYLSTSDEMLPILIASKIAWSTCLLIVMIKIIIGIISGYIIDALIKHHHADHDSIHHLCKQDHCHCEKENVFLSALIHTIKLSVLLFCTTIVLNIIMDSIGQDQLKQWITSLGAFSVLVSALIGFIPNCASSIVITQLFIEGAIPLGTMIAGLLTGAGLGWIVLFRYYKNKKMLGIIIGYVGIVAIVSGILINLFVS